MSTTVQADETGNLHLPSSLLPGSEPLASYHVETEGSRIVISKEPERTTEAESQSPPLWQRAPEERIKALREWLADLPPGPGLSDYAVSRDSMYD
jgi:hypothetical protein